MHICMKLDFLWVKIFKPLSIYLIIVHAFMLTHNPFLLTCKTLIEKLMAYENKYVLLVN